MKLRNILGALVAAVIVAAWGVIFMCYCRVKTGQWWIDGTETFNGEMK